MEEVKEKAGEKKTADEEKEEEKKEEEKKEEEKNEEEVDAILIQTIPPSVEITTSLGKPKTFKKRKTRSRK